MIAHDSKDYSFLWNRSQMVSSLQNCQNWSNHPLEILSEVDLISGKRNIELDFGLFTHPLSEDGDYHLHCEYHPQQGLFIYNHGTLYLQCIKGEEAPKIRAPHVIAYQTSSTHLAKLFDTQIEQMKTFTLVEADFHQIDFLKNQIQLEHIDLETSQSLTDLSILKDFTCLKELGLSSDIAIQDLQSLRTLYSLEDLWLDAPHYKSRNLSFLNDLKKLKILDLNFESIDQNDELSFLANLKNLEHLSLSFSVKALPSLDQLTQLKTLTISQFDDEYFNSLAGLNHLEKLCIYEMNHVKALTALQNLTQLQELSLNSKNNQYIEDLSPLASLTALQVLKLRTFEKVSDLNPLSHLANLHTLDLYRVFSEETSQIEDLSPLRILSKLTSLQLPYKSLVTDLRPISHLNHITQLQISYPPAPVNLTGFTSLKTLKLTKYSAIGLESLNHLEILEMSDCEQLETLNLGHLYHLHKVEIYQCPNLTEIHLHHLNNLETLNISACEKFRHLQVDDQSSFEKLNTLKIYKCYHFKDLTSLMNLRYLKALNLSWSMYLTDLTVLSSRHSIEILILNDCKSLENLTPLTSMKNLKYLWLEGCKSLVDVSILKGLKSLRQINLSWCLQLNTSWCASLDDVNKDTTHHDDDVYSCAYCCTHYKVCHVDHSWDKNRLLICPRCGFDSISGVDSIRESSTEELLDLSRDIYNFDAH